jgi:hypothetical protein
MLAKGVPSVNTGLVWQNQAGREIENPVMSQGIGDVG